MARFSDEQIVHLVAYQNLYGPITPRRTDVLLARLGMDLIKPHLRKGRHTVLRDHLMTWSHADRPRQSGREMLAIVKDLQRQYDQDDQQRAQRIRRTRRKAVAHGGSG
ncbi:hypothetical protein [Streptomyces sp. TRM68416]|uniref:hypothetical protein n=1 Tax=Streptomyces sp. TRM68416 TaxID=2758412 RepID=UPI0016618BC2|nr:hypothetical protein [Streptomyces sp. TRM68416]MBD0838780.1 hypothetical protein [Streptomyces sp. TRM68416]